MAQEQLAPVFHHIYSPKAFVHGYVKQRSFLTNAEYHANQRWVFNVDILNFFGTVSFARVRGLLMSNLFGILSVSAQVV